MRKKNYFQRRYKSDSADTDGDGNNISETYETKINAAAKFAEKNELPPFTFSIGILKIIRAYF